MHYDTAETLLAVITALSAKFVVGNAISFVQKQCPILFLSFFGAKIGQNCLSKPFKKITQGICTNLWLCMKF